MEYYDSRLLAPQSQLGTSRRPPHLLQYFRMQLEDAQERLAVSLLGRVRLLVLVGESLEQVGDYVVQRRTTTRAHHRVWKIHTSS